MPLYRKPPQVSGEPGGTARATPGENSKNFVFLGLISPNM